MQLVVQQALRVGSPGGAFLKLWVSLDAQLTHARSPPYRSITLFTVAIFVFWCFSAGLQPCVDRVDLEAVTIDL
jgi:hypothetical protein